jgi:aromatic ring-opening dioxygenase catalytic subunit (LigB family)
MPNGPSLRELEQRLPCVSAIVVALEHFQPPCKDLKDAMDAMKLTSTYSGLPPIAYQTSILV